MGATMEVPAQNCLFLPQQKRVVVDAGCWQTLHQLKPQQRAHMFPKKHIPKKPIIPTTTVKRATAMFPSAIASEEEPSSASIPLSYIINVGTIILATTLQPSFLEKTVTLLKVILSLPLHCLPLLSC
jgi:hypothetical protein